MITIDTPSKFYERLTPSDLGDRFILRFCQCETYPTLLVWSQKDLLICILKAIRIFQDCKEPNLSKFATRGTWSGTGDGICEFTNILVFGELRLQILFLSRYWVRQASLGVENTTLVTFRNRLELVEAFPASCQFVECFQTQLEVWETSTT